MHSSNDYEAHFNTELYFSLDEFEKKRGGIISKVIIAKLLGILTIMVFLSLFMGFLNAFPFDDFDMGIAIYFFEGFFYFVLSLVVFGIMQKSIKYILEVKGNKSLLKNKKKLFLLTVIAETIVLICAFTIGKMYLGVKVFNVSFFIRYIIAFFSIFALAFMSMAFSKYEKNFNFSLKQEILPKILAFFNSKLKYELTSFIKQTDFIDSRIFPNKEIHTYKGSDFVTGSYGEGLFAFSQLEIKEITTTRSGGKTETKISELFKGLFYVADFNKSFSGKTVIYPDFARQALGGQLGEMINHKMEFDNNQLITLEDIEFEKEFAVYSTDQVEARYILSPSMIERIKLIKQKLEKDIYFSFIKNRVYVAIPSETEILVPNIFHNITRFESIEPIYYAIDSLLDISKDLQLNTRIWGKV